MPRQPITTFDLRNVKARKPVVLVHAWADLDNLGEFNWAWDRESYSSNEYYIDDAPNAVSTSTEGIEWIRGHVPLDSSEANALRTADILYRADLLQWLGIF